MLVFPCAHLIVTIKRVSVIFYELESELNLKIDFDQKKTEQKKRNLNLQAFSRALTQGPVL